MTNSDGTTTITLNHADEPDAEARLLAAFVEAVRASRVYLALLADVRATRGVDTTPQEADDDSLSNIEHGYQRALSRRKRELGQLVTQAKITRAVTGVSS